MSFKPQILEADTTPLAGGIAARALGQKLYLNEFGDLVIASHPQPGWIRMAVRIKSPTSANVVPLPCIA